MQMVGNVMMATLRQNLVGGDDQGITVKGALAAYPAPGQSLQDGIMKGVPALAAEQVLTLVGDKVNRGPLALAPFRERFSDDAS